MVSICNYCHTPTVLNEEGSQICENPYCQKKLLERIEDLERHVESLSRITRERGVP